MPAPKQETAAAITPAVPFPQQARFAESLTWPLEPFNLPAEDSRFRVKSGRVIIGTSGCNSGFKVYATTDMDVEVLSQKEIETGVRVKDQPIVPGQTRKTSTRYVDIRFPRVWIGTDMAVDFVGEEDGVVSFCLRSAIPTLPPEEIYSSHSFNDYPV